MTDADRARARRAAGRIAAEVDLDRVATRVRTVDPMTALTGSPDGFGPAAPRTPIAGPAAVGRNDPCPCGSGKKWKACHRKVG